MAKGSWREFEDPEFSSTSDLDSSLLPKNERKVRVYKTRGGKNGKTVTVISGLGLGKDQGKSLLKILKSNCGTGGTVKGNLLELQGDQVKAAIELLISAGFPAKQSGG